ncbi:hypothetical protein BDQ17DRAFT_1431639 [Cyathus striatus]|nr:hypothetical protein BDQ17DRAFT_1431639 [Cyathus striatus]
MSSLNLNTITLSESDKLIGYENYPKWKLLMEAHGNPKGLGRYCKNRIVVPMEYWQEGDKVQDEHMTTAEENKGEEEEGKEKDDNTPLSTSSMLPKSSKPSKPIISPASEVKFTPLHSPTPLALKYELCESVALSSIIINVVDIYGSGIDPNQKSHITWKLLEEQYGQVNDHTRNT